MDKDKLKRLNTLRKKLREWENQGYNVSPLKKDIEAFEKQEGIRYFPSRVAFIILLILAVVGVGVGIGINYHKKQIAIQEKLKQEEAKKKKELALKQAERAKKKMKSPAKVEVPNLNNVDLETAKMLLDAKGLSLVKEGEKADPTVLKGKIMFQNPFPGAVVEKGTFVKVIVSKGQPPPTVENVIAPDVSGLTLSQAKVLIANKGLIVGEVTDKISDEKKGIVLSSTPDAGAEVPKNFRIDLVVSKGPQLVTVPRLINKDVGTARILLQRKGLRLGHVSYTTSAEYNFDVIISQHPLSGKRVKKGTSVSVSVNKEGY